MTTLTRVCAALVAIGCGCSLTTAAAQSDADAHVAKARAASQMQFDRLFDTTCGLLGGTPAQPASSAAPAAAPPPAPSRTTWQAEPVKVFDNLYFVGEKEYSAWAITTSAGIIVIDAIFDYSVEEQVVNGLKALGLDPGQIRYVVVSHAHRDHAGGAKLLQDRGARIVMSAEDWDLQERTAAYPKARRDVVAVDGQKLTLGDTTVTLHLTPGHTLGTMSMLIPVRDGQNRHMAAYWGGTAFNWMRGSANYITSERPARFWFDTYARSAARFRDLAQRAGADVLLSNHTTYDGSTTKLGQVRSRQPGTPHPYVIGSSAVQRFLTVAEECAQAGGVRAR